MIEHVNAAIECCTKNIENVINISVMDRCMSRQNFNREFRTIHVNFGRRTGKTQTIAALSRPTDLVIVHNEETKKHFPRCNAEVKTISEVIRHIQPSPWRTSCSCRCSEYVKKYEYVWIDEPALCMKFLDSYKAFYELDAQLFIMLGE